MILLTIGMFAMAFAYLFLTAYDFVGEYKKGVQESTSAKNFWNNNCARDEVRHKVGVTDIVCREMLDVASRNPWVYASVLIARQWTLCGSDGCKKIFLELRDSLFWIFVGVVCILLFLSLCCGMNIFRALRLRDEASYALPSYGMQHPPPMYVFDSHSLLRQRNKQQQNPYIEQ